MALGLFEDALPLWAKNSADPIAFMHIDSDIYSSAKTIFKYLREKIKQGTVIVFDEYFGIGWKHHEFKAFQEFVSSRNVKYEYLCYGNRQVAVRITEI